MIYFYTFFGAPSSPKRSVAVTKGMRPSYRKNGVTMKISLCMIVKDEEETLARCLESAKTLADEIVIVDTGSKDGTVEIAKTYTERVFFFAWEDDFAKARNFSFSRASGDYLLWLDADDVITPGNAEKFCELRRTLAQTPCDTVMCPYETGGLVYLRERLLKNCSDAKWRGHVHECIPPFGKILHSDFTIKHLPKDKDKGMRNLLIYQKWAEKEKLSGRDLFYYGRELYYHKLYTEAAAILKEMLAGGGWYVNKIEACKVLASCHLAQGDPGRALSALFQSFLYGEPRGSVLCDVGSIFKAQKKYREAAYWYEAALSSRDHSEEGDFELPACRGLTPLLELVVCHHALGDRNKAIEYHKKSEAIAPDHPSVLYNKKFFGL